MKKIAIMQPTYLPWVGYLAMMNSVDEFVILDHVQFARRSWQQRNRIVNVGKEQMLSVPVKKVSRDTSIENIELANPEVELIKHLKSIEQAYKTAPYFNDYFDDLKTCYQNVNSLKQLNMNIIIFLAKSFEIDTKISFSSDLGVSGSKSELMFNICKEVNAEMYISSPGSKEYMESVEGFDFDEIPVKYFEYIPCEYTQCSNEFIPYMAAIDALFNIGNESIKKLKAGYRP